MLTWVSAGIAVWVGKGQRVCTPLYLCLYCINSCMVEHHLFCLQHLVHHCKNKLVEITHFWLPELQFCSNFAILATKNGLFQPICFYSDAALYILCASSPVVCLSLPPINNGRISYTDSTLGLNTVATPSCERGYELTGGDTMRTCTVSGWDGTERTCTIASESVDHELALSAAI